MNESLSLFVSAQLSSNFTHSFSTTCQSVAHCTLILKQRRTPSSLVKVSLDCRSCSNRRMKYCINQLKKIGALANVSLLTAHYGELQISRKPLGTRFSVYLRVFFAILLSVFIFSQLSLVQLLYLWSLFLLKMCLFVLAHSLAVSQQTIIHPLTFTVSLVDVLSSHCISSLQSRCFLVSPATSPS